MVASLTVSMASGTPSEAAVRSSPSSRARAIPRRRWVGATVTALIAHASTVRCPGTVSGATHELTVATGAATSVVDSSQTPVVRR